jgi:hypothetical protein
MNWVPQANIPEHWFFVLNGAICIQDNIILDKEKKVPRESKQIHFFSPEQWENFRNHYVFDCLSELFCALKVLEDRIIATLPKSHNTILLLNLDQTWWSWSYQMICADLLAQVLQANEAPHASE